jgi:hypothetical protein|tara:strand:- start:2766 stop:3158 length:393 start_codon:yes stop_codon:yes gene_type:complete
MKKLFNGENFDRMIKSAQRTSEMSKRDVDSWEGAMKGVEKADVEEPASKSAITRSFDYVYERLGGHEGFLEWAQFSPKNTAKFYEWRAKQLQKESAADAQDGKVVINVLNYNDNADSIQLPAAGLSDTPV